MGEGAGASELMLQAIRAVAYEWTQRGPATRLTAAFSTQLAAIADALLEGLATDRMHIGPEAARLVFEAPGLPAIRLRSIAALGGPGAGGVSWLRNPSIEFERMTFDVVLIGSLFEGGTLLTEPMREVIQVYAPGATWCGWYRRR